MIPTKENVVVYNPRTYLRFTKEKGEEIEGDKLE